MQYQTIYLNIKYVHGDILLHVLEAADTDAGLAPAAQPATEESSTECDSLQFSKAA